jgi:acyl-CoA thioesterase I
MNAIALVPFLLNGVATSESLMQRDGIHPKPEAQQMMLDEIFSHLAPLLAPVTPKLSDVARKAD